MASHGLSNGIGNIQENDISYSENYGDWPSVQSPIWLTTFTTRSSPLARIIDIVAESFFATFKKRTVHGQTLKTKTQMRHLILEFIEIYYNRVRRHSANGWGTPVEFERLYNQNLEFATV
jgi:hypothetical protein